MMADRNAYLRYKRDQRHLVYWIVNTSAGIIHKSPSEASTAINTTGVVSLATLQSLSALIAKHLSPIPTTIFRLFESIIDARKETHDFFLKITAAAKDPEIQKSNDSHKHWIDGLTQAFHALGGDIWKAKKSSRSDVLDEDEDEVIFANKFSTLSLDGETAAEGEEDIAFEGNEGGNTNTASQASFGIPAKKTNRKPNKNKKTGKKAKKPKGARKTADGADSHKLQDVPLESYRIIEDDSGTVTEYLMAVYSLVRQMMELRHHLQGVWRQVAYDGLNSAVAANVSNVAIEMIKDTQSQIFVDFPGHDSFETVVQTLTRGNPDKAQGMFHASTARQNACGHFEKPRQYDINVKEEFFLNGYQDLFDFVTDFQQTRSGKPTKSMLKSLQYWNPNLNLAKASRQERMKWRRTYTINWLYDLVNVFSGVVVQRRTNKKQPILLERVDWSRNGPWIKHRVLFGINDFAGDITHLAMQKAGTDIRAKILPHHVFQLQCMVDSMTVSRGWSIGVLVGHAITIPAPGFRPRRDVDIFMDRDVKRKNTGICQSIDILKQLMERDAMMHGDPKRNGFFKDLMVELFEDFRDWLGDSKYQSGLVGIPPSRFSETNSNGLWEYSPFLCGAGLSEALELSYGAAMLIWDNVPEPICVIHLHNMLAHKGLLKRGVGLWDSLGVNLFQDAIFNGKPPTSNFLEAFENRVGGATSRREIFRNRAQMVQMARNAKRLNDLLDPSVNRFFKLKSMLEVYQAANWNPDRIPDEEIPTPSMLSFLRIAETKQIKDRVTGEVTLEATDLVKRFKARGMKDKDIIDLASDVHAASDSSVPDAYMPDAYKQNMKDTMPEEFSFGSAPPPVSGSRAKTQLPTYLTMLQRDFISDICGELRPLSAHNYFKTLAYCHIIFMEIEDKLKDCGNPSWAMAYEGNSILTKQKRLSLTVLALKEEDPECLKIMAEVFEQKRCGFIDNIYWDDLTGSEDMISPEQDDEGPFGTDRCTLM
ncbi:unnamed protein product [Penicillium salamii]|nr:unnamed protein product [Penicillium salamii]